MTSLSLIAEPQIVETEDLKLAIIPLLIKRTEMMSVIGPAVAELRNVIAVQGLASNAPWFAHHHKMTPGIFDFQVCIPVSEAIAPQGRVLAGSWPAGTVARTTYQGNYNRLHEAWGEFQDWIEPWLETNGCSQGIDLYERYLITPGETQSPAEWITELNRPILPALALPTKDQPVRERTA